MSSIAAIMKKVEEDQYNQFVSLINADKNTMSRKKYLLLFLSTFLGNPEKMGLTDNMNKSQFEISCHYWIKGVSLCEPEIDFFHKMVNAYNGSDYIADYLKLFKETEDLDKCQLGPNIKKCLEASVRLTFV